MIWKFLGIGGQAQSREKSSVAFLLAGFHVGTIPYCVPLHLPTGILPEQEASGGLRPGCLWPDGEVGWSLQQQMTESVEEWWNGLKDKMEATFSA